MSYNFGTTRNGNPSSKLANGRNWRKLLKIKTVAQLESNLYSDDEIAIYIGCTPQYVRMLKNTPEYISARISASTGMLAQTERKALETLDDRRAAMDDMVPEALVAIRNAILDHSNPTLQLKASQDLLDRQGDLAKVSKTEVKLPNNFNWDEHDKTAGDLLSALAAVGAGTAVSESSVISGVSEFTNTSLDRDQQKVMQDAMELINKAADLDGKKVTIN
jgi:hypothetical protein